MTTQTIDRFICAKDVDRSLLRQGFTLPVGMLFGFKSWFGNNLKRIYGHRCQICGQQVAEEYSVTVDEVHHIDPFVTSLNNDVSNLLVLCPNHHRVIHAAHPDFHRPTLSFVYPNGLNEKLKINLHL